MRKPRHRNSTRDREKAELSTLRGLVPELEAHLAVLRRGEPFQRGSRSAWRCFSERQARARQTAERTNRVLNGQVQSNADWIQRLWELLCEKRRAVEASSLRRIAALQQKAEDDLVLKHLNQLAQAAVLQLPTVFAANGVQLLHGDADLERDLWSHVQTGDSQSTLVCVRRVPFDVHSTSAALWTTLSCPDRSFASEENSAHDVTPVARVLERSPITCAMKFQGAAEVKPGELTPLNYHAVVHRTEIAEPVNASVFVWQSFFELADRGVSHHDTLWAAVTRSPSGGLESTVTVVGQSRAQARADASDLLASIMPATDACVESILLSADNILFEESLGGSSRPSRSNEEALVQAIDV